MQEHIELKTKKKTLIFLSSLSKSLLNLIFRKLLGSFFLQLLMGFSPNEISSNLCFFPQVLIFVNAWILRYTFFSSNNCEQTLKKLKVTVFQILTLPQ